MLGRAKLPEPFGVDIDGDIVPVQIRLVNSARRFILRVTQDTGEIILTIPPRSSKKAAKSFVDSHRGWIANQVSKCAAPVPFEPGETIPVEGRPTRLVKSDAPGRFIRYEEDAGELVIPGYRDPYSSAVERWLKARAKERLNEAIEPFARQMGREMPRITLRDPRSRWGSCSTTGTLSFSWRLILAPAPVLTYVAAHEMAHFEHFNHSPAFWRLVKELDPQCDKAMRWIKREGLKLHAYGRPRWANDG